jgi:tetratricopeptide (TPR) repeat protein
MSPPSTTSFEADPHAILNHLERIEESEAFNDVKEQRWVLRFVVEETLAGRGAKGVLKATKIAKEVFGEADGQIARTHFGRLRRTLLAYYRYEPPTDGIEIELPERGYTPTFSRQPMQDAGSPTVDSASAFTSGNKQPWVMPRPLRFFTGREAFLATLRDTLLSNSSDAVTQPQAITGLPGIGKTQTAIEYAYKYRDQYTAAFWVNGESRSSLLSGFLSVAKRLDISKRGEEDINRAAEAVRWWLEANSGWLLILDNVDDLDAVFPFIPAGNGHCLITTRLPTISSIGESSELREMDVSDGALFLLRRAKVISRTAALGSASKADRETAEELAAELGGLALALDQAGAYIDETPSTLGKYLDLYRSDGTRLRAERGQHSSGHLPLTKTFQLVFATVEAKNPAAADIVRASAFLGPDATPEEIFAQIGQHLGPHISQIATREVSLTTALKDAARFALIRRNRANNAFDVHRLTQQALRDSMSSLERRTWIERVAIALHYLLVRHDGLGVDLSFDAGLVIHLTAFEACVTEYDNSSLPAAHAFCRIALCLLPRSEYGPAERLFQKTLTVYQKVLGPEAEQTLGVITALGIICQQGERYQEAETLLQQVLKICEKVFGPDSPRTAGANRHLGDLYGFQGRFAEARQLLKRSLAVSDKALGHLHPQTIMTMHSLANLHEKNGDDDEAEAVFSQALVSYDEAGRAVDRISAASLLSDFANFLSKLGRFGEAEPLMRQALTICENVFGPDSPRTVSRIQDLSSLHLRQGRFAEARQLLERSVRIREKIYGVGDPDVAASRRAYENLSKFVFFDIALTYDNAYAYAMSFLAQQGYVIEVADRETGRLKTKLVTDPSGKTGRRLSIVFARKGMTTHINVAVLEQPRVSEGSPESWGESRVDERESKRLSEKLRSALERR